MPKKIFQLILTVSTLLLSSAFAAEVEGVKLEDKIRLPGGGPELVLNGAGVRHKFGFLKIYVGSLYLAQKKSEREAVLGDPGPKRVGMNILANEVTSSELISSMNNALAANLVPHELALIEKRIRDLNNMMSSIKTIGKGSVVYLDYIPGTGTRITVNGEEKIIIPGEDFFRAMLHIWIGKKPVDGRLRDAMLGGSSGFRLF
ncbi:MAG: chalcone isomerase family protein [Betaproteobacteria bacterium]|nr:chalcone isomerase family protein [Betaproteobacteria bacterium]